MNPESSVLSALKSQRAVITGPCGFIGSHLVQALCSAGMDVTAILVKGQSSRRLDDLSAKIKRVEVDDEMRFSDVIRKLAPNYVAHLSASISLDRTLKMVEQTIHTNLISTISLLTACTEIKVNRVLLMGSCEEYGQKFCPFDTALAADPNSPYGASKAAATAYARMFSQSFALPTVVLRPSVVYGPRQSPRQLIPMVFRALAANQKIDVTAGRQTRDFVFIDDVLDAMMIAMTAPEVVGETWNIGSGEVVTVQECLALMEQITGRYGLIQYGARPYGESERFHYEPIVRGTYDTFKWRPKVTLEEGLRRTWASFSQTGQVDLEGVA